MHGGGLRLLGGLLRGSKDMTAMPMFSTNHREPMPASSTCMHSVFSTYNYNNESEPLTHERQAIHRLLDLLTVCEIDLVQV